ncbi:MAG: alpha/beta hydrolase [Sphingomonadales bacterium]
MRYLPQGLLLVASLVLITPPLAASPVPGSWVDAVTPVVKPAEPDAIALPVALPRANTAHEAWAQQTPDQRIAYNIVRPELIPVPGSLPATTNAPAVLLVPGGGFQFLAMDNEGYDVARRLDRLGVRVFIVKYRTLPVPDNFAGFKEAIAQTFQKGALPAEDNRPFAVADTQAAIRTMRANAIAWHIDPARIGILGFSAGAVTVLGTAQANDPGARADFVGMIYGPTQGSAVPPNAPPLFAAIAANDRFFKAQDLSLIHAWRQSGSPVELHLYSGGGHGFASHPNGTTSDAWFNQFALWLEVSGVLNRR